MATGHNDKREIKFAINSLLINSNIKCVMQHTHGCVANKWKCVCVCVRLCACVLLKMRNLMIWSKMLLQLKVHSRNWSQSRIPVCHRCLAVFRRQEVESHRYLNMLDTRRPQHLVQRQPDEDIVLHSLRYHLTILFNFPFSKKKRICSAYTLMQIHRNCTFILKLDNYSVWRVRKCIEFCH